MPKMYEELYLAWKWRQQANEKFEDVAQARLDAVFDLLPSGSGFDSGTKVESIDASRMVLYSAFHKMIEHGSYVGWDEFRVVVKAAFDGIDIRIFSTAGRIKPEDREYYEEEFYRALTQDVPAWDPNGKQGE